MAITYSTVETRVMNALRIPTTNTTEQAKVLQTIQDVYRDICAKTDWWWLSKRVLMATTPKVSSGTVSVTQNNTAITFSTAPQQYSSNVSVSGFTFLVSGSTDDALATYRISSHTSAATAATLDAVYTGTTDTAATFTCYNDVLELASDVGKLLSVKRYGDPRPLERVGWEEMSRLKGFNRTEGRPQVYTVYDFETAGTPSSGRLLHLHPYPDIAYRLEVWYKQRPTYPLSDSNNPIIPDEFEQTLYYGALARGFPLYLNDLERGAYYQSLFNDVMALMTAQQREYASDAPTMQPEMRTYRSPARSRRSGSVTLGGWFDRLPTDW